MVQWLLASYIDTFQYFDRRILRKAMAPKRKAAAVQDTETKKPKKESPSAKAAAKSGGEAEIWFSVEHW